MKSLESGSVFSSPTEYANFCNEWTKKKGYQIIGSEAVKLKKTLDKLMLPVFKPPRGKKR